MKLTAKIKLTPTSAQASALHETLSCANDACNFISDIAWREQNFKQYDLHERCYYTVRDEFGLSAQMAVRALGKVIHAYKSSVALLKKRNMMPDYCHISLMTKW